MTTPVSDTYLTIAGKSQGFFREKGSKFLAFAYPVSNLQEFKARLEAIKKQYHDARHHCYAYILGSQGLKSRANDDGEPRHSAGDPILGQIKSRQLTNTMVVVVRYFGGTKLGVPGLVNAYKTAAQEALTNNQIIEKVVQEVIEVQINYEHLNQLMWLINQYSLTIIRQRFESTVLIELGVRKSLMEQVGIKLQALPSLEILNQR